MEYKDGSFVVEQAPAINRDTKRIQEEFLLGRDRWAQIWVDEEEKRETKSVQRFYLSKI
jgi:hypothetical protein